MTDSAKEPKAKVEAVKVPSKKTFKVIMHLNHDNHDYQPGDTVPMDEDTASSLIDLGVIEEA